MFHLVTKGANIPDNAIHQAETLGRAAFAQALRNW
jgi:hypothetical protein